MSVWDGVRAEKKEDQLSLSLVRSVLSGQTNPGGVSFLHTSYYGKIFTLLGMRSIVEKELQNAALPCLALAVKKLHPTGETRKHREHIGRVRGNHQFESWRRGFTTTARGSSTTRTRPPPAVWFTTTILHALLVHGCQMAKRQILTSSPDSHPIEPRGFSEKLPRVALSNQVQA